MKQTAVDWLDSNLIHAPHSQEDFTHNYRVFEQAKAMEQEQIEESYNTSYGFIDGKEYYNGTYGNNN